MKNIVDTVIELLEKSEKNEISIPQIKKELKDLKKELDSSELDASIYSDLLNDGRFIFVNGKWSLKEGFTMKEIVKEHYKALGNMESLDTSNDELEEEETTVILESDETQEIDVNAIEELEEFVDFEEENED